VFVSETLIGERIGLEPIDERWYTIYFATFPLAASTVEPEPCIDCQRQTSTELMQGKGNRPLPLHPIPKNRTKICQLCPRSKLDKAEKSASPAGEKE